MLKIDELLVEIEYVKKYIQSLKKRNNRVYELIEKELAGLEMEEWILSNVNRVLLINDEFAIWDPLRINAVENSSFEYIDYAVVSAVLWSSKELTSIVYDILKLAFDPLVVEYCEVERFIKRVTCK